MISKPFILGLTGSIGTGKTTVAKIFAEYGARVWNADMAVFDLYEANGAGVSLIADVCPEAVPDPALGVDRRILRQWAEKAPDRLYQLEEVIHPLVAKIAQAAIDEARRDGVSLLVMEIPLLFETGMQKFGDAVVVTSLPYRIARERVIARGTMTAKQYELVRARQMADDEKMRLADYLIETQSTETARSGVISVLKAIALQ